MSFNLGRINQEKLETADEDVAIKNDLETVYKDFNPEERRNNVLQRLERKIFEGTPLTRAIPYDNLLEIVEKVREFDTDVGLLEFQEGIYEIIKPLIDLQKNNPDLIKETNELAVRMMDKGRQMNQLATPENSEELRQKKTEEIEQSENKLFFSKILIGEIRENTIGLHIAPARDLSLVALRKDILQGFRKMAEYVNANKKIETIEGQSWIVTQYPGLLEILGFTVAKQEMGFESIAVMSRDELINKYLNK